MEISREGSAGTLESGDARVTVRPNPGKGLSIALRGPSVPRYGKAIGEAVLASLGALGVAEAEITIDEKGALDATIQARLTAAACRAGGAEAEAVPWEAMP